MSTFGSRTGIENRNRQIKRGIIISIQWLMLTIALGSLVLRTEASLTRVISPHFDAWVMLAAAFVFAILLGMTIESLKALLPAVTLMCLLAASFFYAIILSPVWEGTLMGTQALENFALTRVVLIFGLLILPSVPGAFIGNFLGDTVDASQEFFPDESQSGAGDRPWWELRSRT